MARLPSPRRWADHHRGMPESELESSPTPVLLAAAKAGDHAAPQASSQTQAPRETTATQWHQASGHQAGAYVNRLSTQAGDRSPIYVFK
jgi:hypothetical protein